MSGLAGVVDYDPAELTFTALPGTTLAEIDAMLAANGQHLPFDPPRLGDGGTIGGAVGRRHRAERLPPPGSATSSSASASSTAPAASRWAAAGW